jgi:ubiquinone/menaquinone biosynthesis C-methylase UbiE
MDFIRMGGEWGPLASHLYNVFAGGIDDVYARCILEIVGDSDPGEILDVGSGPGHATALCAERRPGARVTGVDASPTMVRIAQARAKRKALPNLSFRHGDALALPFDDARFDLVYSIGSIKHWPDRARGVRELSRVLKPGGRMVLLEIDRGAPLDSLRGYVRNWPLVPPLFAVLYFRLIVSTQAIDGIEAADIAAQSGLRDYRVERIPGMPVLALHARKN